MSFYTEIEIPEFPWKMDYSRKMMMMGSCFSENIGQKMLDLKFNVDMNPFGVIYNPISIANSLKILLENRVYTERDLFFDRGMWNSFSHHSRFSDENRENALEKINSRITLSHDFLKESDYLVISFGTAWVYELKKTGEIVSNCHKEASSEFMRFRLGVYQILEVYRELLEQIWKFNPNLKVVFTVSPIRHWKDGAVENQVSKATLLLAIDGLIKGFGDSACRYFPAYEIMMDELRDYRFYAGDMLHLSPVAIEYIFDRFSKTIIDSGSKKLMNEIEKIRKALMHRPVNPASDEYRRFLFYNLNEINKLTINFPYLNFKNEMKYLEKELTGFQE